jgi:hypothetical protein
MKQLAGTFRERIGSGLVVGAAEAGKKKHHGEPRRRQRGSVLERAAT